VNCADTYHELSQNQPSTEPRKRSTDTFFFAVDWAGNVVWTARGDQDKGSDGRGWHKKMRLPPGEAAGLRFAKPRRQALLEEIVLYNLAGEETLVLDQELLVDGEPGTTT
jgi:hypothetical protein